MSVTEDLDLAVVERIADSLICPDCGAGLRLATTELSCTGCDAAYPIRDGILRLARLGTVADERAPGEERTSERYQVNYQEVAPAEAYNAAYRDKPTKRMSTRREYRLLDELLRSQPRSERLLDLPCGGGRLSPALAPYTSLLIEADIGAGQVQHARQHARLDLPQVWMTASAFGIPLRDGSVDGVVCCRLSHHMPQPAERERLVRELVRVARRFVIMTYFEHNSLKNLGRRLRAPFNGKPPKMTMTREQVARLAAEGGARLVACPWLSRVGSGHRYALMVKDSGAA